MKIPERTAQSKKGLINFCKYINKFFDTKKLTILEIGSWTGASADIFAQYFQKVICVDPWKIIPNTITDRYNMKDVEKKFNSVMAKYDNIEKIKRMSKDAAKIIMSVDIVYIDADHTYLSVKKDIQLWKDKAKLFISGHDYWKKFPGVIKAVDEMLGKPDKVFLESSWIIRR